MTLYFSAVLCQMDNDQACIHKEVIRYFSGVIIISLLAALSLTIMCRVCVLGQWSSLQFKLCDAIKRQPADQPVSVADAYWNWQYKEGCRVKETLHLQDL